MTNRRQKIKIRLIENNDISCEEQQRIWNIFFDLMLKKSISENESSEERAVESSEKLLK